MVGGGIHCADTIETGGQTSGDSSLKKTCAISVVVDTLEEGEGLRVRSLLGRQISAEILNSDVAMANDLAALKFLRSSVVGSERIGEGSSNQVRKLDLNVELLVGSDILSGAGEENDCRDHVGV